MKDLLTPKQVATSLGVSESSLKRWCDRGVIATERTPGGHRRIRVGEVIRFLRDEQRPLADPESIGLPTRVGMKVRSVENSTEALDHALKLGDYELCRRLVLEMYLRGNSAIRVFEELLVPVLHELGTGWECGDVEVYEEHRATEVLMRVIYELRVLLPPMPVGAPKAFGCSPSGDLYRISSLMVEVVLAELGFDSQSLGSSLPLSTLSEAIRRHQPGVVWLSVTHAQNSSGLSEEIRNFLASVPNSTRIIIGGQKADAIWAAGAPNVVYCSDFTAIPKAVADLLPTTSAAS